MSIFRPSFTKRGDGYTALAVQCRCVRDDLYTQTVTVHYISDGNCSLRVIMRRGEYFIPAIILLRALKNTSDYEIYSRLVHGKYEGKQLSNRVEIMLRSASTHHAFTKAQALNLLGSKFRGIMRLTSDISD